MIKPPSSALLALMFAGILASCSTTGAKSAGAPGRIRESLDRSGFRDVSAGQDRETGVITLGGMVPSDAARLQAGSIAKSLAAGATVSNEIVVLLQGDNDRANDVRVVGSDPDKGIGSNLDAALAITSQTDPGSHCKAYTDIYLQGNPSRAISVDVKRSNNADDRTSVSTDITYPGRRSYWVGSRRGSRLLVGCQFDGTEINTYTITRADYR